MSPAAGVLQKLNDLNAPSWMLALGLLSILPIPIISVTYMITYIRYRIALIRWTASSPEPNTPPKIPYAIPYLGASAAFLAPTPGVFWDKLFSWYPRSIGSCTLLLGGTPTHILFDTTAIQSIFKARDPTRDRFDLQVQKNALAVESREAERFYSPYDPSTEKLHGYNRFVHDHAQHEYVMRTDRVNELTAAFMQKLTRMFEDAEDAMRITESIDINIVSWLRDLMFIASTYAFMGAKVLDVIPNFHKDFWEYESGFLSLFFGLPSFMIPAHYKARAKVQADMEKFHNLARKECNGQPADPDEVQWDELYGSRLNRARQLFYEGRGLSVQCRAANDLGLLFGLNSNAIPASCWMLLHILDPNGDKTLYPRVMAELETAKRPHGVDIPTLVALPLFQSIFQEILRLYTDVLVSRDITKDMVIPVDEGKKKIQLRKGELVMIPSWLGQRDDNSWSHAPSNVFYAERFLKQNPDTGEVQFTMSGTVGKLFPFGGGKTMCPGRVFAKQEVLGAVALFLLRYKIEFSDFIDGAGKTTKEFPKLGRVFAGSGVIPIDGDMGLRISKRQ